MNDDSSVPSGSGDSGGRCSGPVGGTEFVGGTKALNEFHPLIRGLLMRLPEPECHFSVSDRVRWLKVAVSIFDLIYADLTSEAQARIRIERD